MQFESRIFNEQYWIKKYVTISVTVCKSDKIDAGRNLRPTTWFRVLCERGIYTAEHKQHRSY